VLEGVSNILSNIYLFVFRVRLCWLFSGADYPTAHVDRLRLWGQVSFMQPSWI